MINNRLNLNLSVVLRSCLLFMVLLASTAESFAQVPSALYAGHQDGSNGNQIHIVDTAGLNFTLVDTLYIGSDYNGGTAVEGVYGISQHPVTKDIYMLYEVGGSGAQTRRLGVFNQLTDTIEDIAQAGNFTDITFTADGTLYGVGGNWDANFDVVTINLTTGVPTTFISPTGKTWGSTIAYDPFSDSLIHLTRGGVLNKINTTNVTETADSYTGGGGEFQAMTILNENKAWVQSYGVRYLLNLQTNVMTFEAAGTSSYHSFGFVGVAASCSDTTSAFAVTACGSYIVPSGDETHTTSGVYVDTIPRGCGGDSVMTITVTIKNNATSTDTHVVCDSLTWIDGKTYTASNNTAKDTIINGASNGCDSIITLDLTINNSTTGTDIQIACDSLTWINGITYYANNTTATHTLGNAIGCDSIVTLNLIIQQDTCPRPTSLASITNTDTSAITAWFAGGSETDWLLVYGEVGFDVLGGAGDSVLVSGSPTVTLADLGNCASYELYVKSICSPTISSCFAGPHAFATTGAATSIDTVVECDSSTWINGITYYSSNTTAKDTLRSSLGCDSIITLNLTINNTKYSTDNVSACESYTWINGTTYTASNNSATHTLMTAAGCDSIVTLNLTMGFTSYSTFPATDCFNYTSPSGKYTWTTSGTYQDTIVNASGCDSVMTINLSILQNGRRTVLNTNDNGAGSLREFGLGSCSGDTLVLNAGTILLTSGQIVINQDMVIMGSDSASSVIDGGNLSRIFYIAPGVTVTLSNVKLQNGMEKEGGAIYNRGNLTLNLVAMVNNRAEISNNGHTKGGAIYNKGRITITNSSFIGNSAIAKENSNSYGGAIYNGRKGTCVMTNCIAKGNSAVSFHGLVLAGVIYNHVDSKFELTNSLLSGNEARTGYYGYGGAVVNRRGVVSTITNSDLIDNFAKSSGGAIHNLHFPNSITIVGGVLQGNQTENGPNNIGQGAFNIR